MSYITRYSIQELTDGLRSNTVLRYYSREPRKHKTRGDSVDEDEETGTGIITETVGSYTDESGNKVGHIKSVKQCCGSKTLRSGSVFHHRDCRQLYRRVGQQGGTHKKLLSSVADPKNYEADPGLSFHFDVAPDSSFPFDADPEPDPSPHESDAILRPLVDRPSTTPFWASKALHTTIAPF